MFSGEKTGVSKQLYATYGEQVFTNRPAGFRQWEPYPYSHFRKLPRGKAVNLYTKVETLGFSMAGKDTLGESIKRELDGVWRARFLPELQWEFDGHFLNRDVTYNPKIWELGVEQACMYLEQIKLGGWKQGVSETIRQFVAEDRPGGGPNPGLIWANRGPHDVIVHCDWVDRVATGKRELDEDTYDEYLDSGAVFDTEEVVYHGFRQAQQMLFYSALHAAQYVDVVIFANVSQPETEHRRVNQGMEPEGRVVNRRYRPVYEQAYGWWLKQIYPLFRERYGTGLLVIDGENSQEANTYTVLSYLVECLGLAVAEGD